MCKQDKKICKVDDVRIASYEKRTRSGSTQVFYTGNDERDFDRYRADGGGRNHNVKMHDKPDTIRLQPPEKHYYASLTEGEWWWVNGCGECNGNPRNWVTYIECEKHDVCRTCKKPRSKLKESPWGGSNGWQCKPCHNAEHEAEKQAALAAMPEDHDEWDYHRSDSVKCPYCDYELQDASDMYSAIDNEQSEECPRCDNTFTLLGETEVKWTTTRTN